MSESVLLGGPQDGKRVTIGGGELPAVLFVGRKDMVALLRECREVGHVGVYGSESKPSLAARIDAALAEPEAGKTVRVRAAVAISTDGCWSVNGWSNATGELPENCDERFKDVASDCNDGKGDVSYYLITADVPLPQAVEVEGEVT